ncbi:MAG: PAS domain S-box protein [Cyanobacteriota bacterium]|nr:PAS domain S-box protein [Cyanobacteriota bacterium]
MTKKLFIICIDDEPTVLESLSRELSSEFGDNFELETAISGIEALELVEELLQEGSEIAVVITDYMMPDLKGDEVLKKIHNISPKTLTIMLSGQATLNGVTNAVNRASLYRYLEKPWQYRELKETVKEALNLYLSEQKIAKQNEYFRQKEIRFAQFVEAMPVGVTIHDAMGEIDYANQKARELLRIDKISTTYLEKLPEAYRVYRAGTQQLYPSEELPIARSLRGESVQTDDLELHHGEQTIPLEVSTTPVFDDEGRVNYAIATFQDISQRKYSEQLLSDYNLVLEKEITARTEGLRQSEERFKKAFETAAIGKCLVTPDGRFLQVNAAGCQFWGYTEQELLSLTFQEITHPEDLDLDLNCLRQLLAGEIPFYHIEKRYLHKNGLTIWALLSVSLVRDANNQPLYFISQIQDITERKHAREALEKSERRYAALTEMAPVGIFRTDSQGNCNFVNSRWCKLAGRTAQEAMGTGWIDALHPQDRDRVAAEWEQSARLDLSFESKYRFLTPDGETVWLIGQAVAEKDAEGNTVSYIGTIADITALKQTEAALQHKNEELKHTLKELKQTQNELIQSEKMAALGQLVASVAHEVNTPLAAIRSSIGHIIEFLEDDFTQFSTFFTQFSPRDRETFFKLLDKTHQSKTQLLAKEKRKIRRRLARGFSDRAISHPELLADNLVDMGIYEESDFVLELLQNPHGSEILDTAYQWTSLLRSAKIVRTATDSAAKVVFALKTYGRYDHSEQKIEASIINGLETVLTLYQKHFKQGINVSCHYPENLPLLLCYPDELNQVWTNLIHNAIQAMDNRGSLSIEVLQEQGQIHVKITDSGSGISEENKKRIFQPFFTTKSSGQGSGLGLDIVQKIVKKHSGTVSVESVPGRTTFTVSLPLLEKSDRPLA